MSICAAEGNHLYREFCVYLNFRLQKEQESPADAGIPARRQNDGKKFLHFEVITSSSQVGNPVFIVIKFLIQITSTCNNS